MFHLHSRKVIFYEILVLFVVVIILLGGELITSFFMPSFLMPPAPEPSTIDPYSVNPYIFYSRPFLYFHLPHARYMQTRSSYQVPYEINARGFRGPEISERASQGRKRLIVIGDSMVEGHGVRFEETFTALIGQLITDSGWDVVNMGVQGASPSYFAANMPRYRAVHPASVLLVINENDVFDDRYREETYEKLPVVDDYWKLLQPGRIARTVDQLRLMTLMRRIRHQYTRSAVEKIIMKNRASGYSESENRQIEEFAKYRIEHNLPPHVIAPEILPKQWQQTSEYIQFIQSQFSGHKIPMMLSFLSTTALEPGKDSHYRQFADDVNRFAEIWSRDHGCPFFSLIPVVDRTIAESTSFVGDVLIPDDYHPTSKVHNAIARELSPWLNAHLPSLSRNH